MLPPEEAKYIELMKWIRSQIASGDFEVGTKLPPEIELGRKFSISRQTVRQATSILESEGLLGRRRGSGTYVLSTGIPKRSHYKNIGVVMTYTDDYIFPSILKGIEKVLTQNNYFMQVAFTYNKIEKERFVFNTFLKNGIDGLIIEPAKSGMRCLNSDLYRKIKAAGIPTIFIHAEISIPMKFPCIVMDDYACGKQAVEHLLAHGHKKIAGIFKVDDIQGQLRYSGVVAALKRHNILTYDYSPSVFWYTTEDMQDIIKGLLDDCILNRIKGSTGLICYNDQIAKLIINILHKDGKTVPNDISIVSFDDLNVRISPEDNTRLTSFVHPKEKLGIAAAEGLLKLIADPDYDASIKFTPKLAERNSVRSIK